MQTFSVQTLGCKVNQYESEQLSALLRSRGLRPVGPGGGADLRIVNTCSVTTEAAAKSRQFARRAGRRDKAPGRPAVSLPRFPGDVRPSEPGAPIEPGAAIDPRDPIAPRGCRVVVTGCWATSDRQAAEALPGVDAVIGHHQDVGAELIRLLDLWQGRSAEKNIRLTDHLVAPETLGNEGWMNKAGSPAGKSTDRITLSSETEVNEKMGEDVLSSGPPKEPATTSDVSQAQGPLGAGPGGAAHEPARAARRGTTALPLLSSAQPRRQRAHLKIQDGCDAHCTYCIIPQLRPELWSKPIADTVAEARQLVAAGHVELVLTGIFLGAYGHRSALRRRRKAQPDDALTAPAVHEHAPLAELTDALCRGVPGLKRLRFSSLEPGDLDADLIAALSRHRQVVPHFHLPLQSGSDRLLRRMNRQYLRQDYLRMVDRLREAFDRPALTTDIIVGFPGETEEDFAATLEVVRHCRFIHIHAFPFSPRPGTAAARWTDRFVPGSTVHQRIEALQLASQADSLAYRRQFIGQIVELLVEREKDEGPRMHPPLRHGRCERYFSVHFQDPAARAGDFVCVRIDRVEGEMTYGSRVGNEPQT